MTSMMILMDKQWYETMRGLSVQWGRRDWCDINRWRERGTISKSMHTHERAQLPDRGLDDEVDAVGLRRGSGQPQEVEGARRVEIDGAPVRVVSPALGCPTVPARSLSVCDDPRGLPCEEAHAVPAPEALSYSAQDGADGPGALVGG
ncbi:hypothetical protein BD413DRAFT_160541 [Trametes elegans]|nr:hypothetical protein BD413DRAFT_160541 [Trametes elegans]